MEVVRDWPRGGPFGRRPRAGSAWAFDKYSNVLIQGGDSPLAVGGAESRESGRGSRALYGRRTR